MPPDQHVEAHHFEALGTRCGIFAVGATRSKLVEGETWVRAMGSRLTRFSPDSEIGRLNASAGEWCEVSDELELILRASLDAYELSGGLVNVAVLRAMLAIGYARPLAEQTPLATAISPDSLPDLPSVLEVGRRRARVARGEGIDLGGIAKGWMADRVTDVIGPNCVVNLGGDLMAVGRGPLGEGWPVEFGGTTLLLRDMGAATSSVRKRRWGDAHHLIDPRTGLPSRTGLDEVSVVATSAAKAEVLAKTALLVGPAAAPAYCAAHALAWWLSP
jgi:thiamine biosynthesis lipoprotein